MFPFTADLAASEMASMRQSFKRLLGLGAIHCGATIASEIERCCRVRYIIVPLRGSDSRGRSIAGEVL